MGTAARKTDGRREERRVSGSCRGKEGIGICLDGCVCGMALIKREACGGLEKRKKEKAERRKKVKREYEGALLYISLPLMSYWPCLTLEEEPRLYTALLSWQPNPLHPPPHPPPPRPSRHTSFSFLPGACLGSVKYSWGSHWLGWEILGGGGEGLTGWALTHGRKKGSCRPQRDSSLTGNMGWVRVGGGVGGIGRQRWWTWMKGLGDGGWGLQCLWSANHSMQKHNKTPLQWKWSFLCS